MPNTGRNFKTSAFQTRTFLPDFATDAQAVLAINGEKDVQVASQANLRAWKDGLTAAGNPKVTVKTFPGLNHLFQHCKTCTVFEYGQLPETISPEVLAYIQEWIAAQTGLKKADHKTDSRSGKN
ncbi:hypothetical protein [Chitinophaga sp. 22620]|uniref:hypothetical protein n=1 Tax=Chitinophaga sp. 22620 TaxID=3453952 RepID=UPI003F86477D